MMGNLFMKLSLFNFFKTIFRSYSPRYSLKIDEKLYIDGELHYQVVAVGEQRPIRLSAKEIIFSKKIKERLVPDDLILVVESFIREKMQSSQYYIKEINRDNTYLLKNKNQTLLVTGDEFCRRLELIEQTQPMDSYRIISNFYFKAGREMEKSLYKEGEITPKSTTVISVVK